MCVAKTVYFIRVQSTDDDIFVRFENEKTLETKINACGNLMDFYYKTSKEASTVLCSVVKHLGSG